MQLIDFRKDTCEVFIGAYYGKDCNNPENEAQWVVTHYFVDGGVVKAEQVKYIAWTDRETATYSPHEIDQGNIPAIVLDNLLNCVTEDNFDYEKLILCHPIEGKVIMESWTDITDPTQTPTRRYIILSSGLEYTGPVSELEDCGAEKYDIVYAGDFCDGGIDLSRYDIIDLSDKSIQGSYFTNNLGVIVVPIAPVKGACNKSVVLQDINCATANPNVKECNSASILAQQVLTNTKLDSAIIQLTAINGNTDNIETLITSTNTKLDGLSASLGDILTQVTAINANTDTIETQLTGVINLITTGNSTLVSIDTKLSTANTVLNNILTQVTSINANTDTIETSLLNVITEIIDLQNIVQTEFDQTQLLQTATNVKLDNVINKLSETCAGNPINVNVCPASALGLLHTNLRGSGNNTYTSPYRSLSVTAISDDVTIDGQLVPKGMTISYGTNANEFISNDTTITGTDYFTTLLQ